MLLFRVTLALAAVLILPATALADLRSPVLGETSVLSTLTPQSRTYPPAIATDGNTTYVAYMEERTGITFHRITAAGTEIGAPRELQSPGTASTEYPQIVVSGENVYVAWIQGSYTTPEKHAVVAASHDGGRTFEQAVMAGTHTTGGGAFDLRLGADGDNVFVAFVDNRGRVWTAGSRDGGRTFPCMAVVSSSGDEADGGGDYSLVVDGPRIYWVWLTDEFDIVTRRSIDGGRTLEPPVKLIDSPGRQDYPGVPTIRAKGGTVAIAYSKQFTMPREDKTGTDWGYEPEVLSSTDGGTTWTTSHIGDEATRCIGNYCAAPYGLDIDGDDVYLSWRAQGHDVDRALAAAGGAGWDGPTQLGPYIYAYHSSHAPYVDARGDTVVATWFSESDPDNIYETNPITAFSSDHGRSYTLRTIDDRAGQDMSPVAAAWGPEPQGAGFAWWSWDEHLLHRRHARALRAAERGRAGRRRDRRASRPGRDRRRAARRGPPDDDPDDAALARRRGASASSSTSSSPTTTTAAGASRSDRRGGRAEPRA